jgi:hypothetical protein
MAFALPLLPVIGALGAGGGAAALGGTLATSLAVGGTALSGLSAFQQSQYQASVAKNNARIAEQNAGRASDAAQIDQLRSDREFASQEATALAAQSASGLDVLGRSQILSRANVARVRGEQAVDIRKQGLIDVGNFYQEQANFLGEERAAKTKAWTDLAATAFGVGGSIAKDPTLSKKANTLIGGAKSVLGVG